MDKNNFGDQVIAAQIIKAILWSTPRKIIKINILTIAMLGYFLIIMFNYPSNILFEFSIGKIIIIFLPIIFLILLNLIMNFRASSKKIGYLLDKYMEEIHEEGIERFRIKLEKNPKIAEEIRSGLYETEKRANPFTLIFYRVETPSFEIIKRGLSKKNIKEHMNEIKFVEKIEKNYEGIKKTRRYNLFKKK